MFICSLKKDAYEYTSINNDGGGNDNDVLELWLWASQCSKGFTYRISLDSQNSPTGEVPASPKFTV